MSIRFQIRGRVFCIDIGHKTKWYSSIHFVTVIEEFWEHGQVEFAKVVWGSNK